MRKGFAAFIAIIMSLFAVTAVATAAPSQCVGLGCATPSDPNYVAEAQGVATTVSSPQALEEQTAAGFYDVAPSESERQIAFVVPAGQQRLMPDSIRRIPLVQAIATETRSFQTSSVVIFSPDVVEWDPPVPATTSKRKLRKRGRARVATNDAYGCPELVFCLFDLDNWQGAGIAISNGYAGAGWFALSSFGWNDRANSMRNRRDYDTRLDKNYPATSGSNDLYCGDSHSVDSDFTNNFGGPAFPGANGGDNEASAFSLQLSDGYC